MVLSRESLLAGVLVLACGSAHEPTPPSPPPASSLIGAGGSAPPPAISAGAGQAGSNAGGGMVVTLGGASLAGAMAEGASVGGRPESMGGASSGAAGSAGSAPMLPPMVLAYSATTEFRHESIEPAIRALTEGLKPFGVSVEASEDPKLMTSSQLARFGAVALVSVTGKPYGDPGTAEITALTDFVNSGGGLVGIHGSTYAYMDLPDYVSLLGANYADHPGYVHSSTCYRETDHPSVIQLPMSLVLEDEFYTFVDFRADNQVVLRCDSVDHSARIPIAWYRNQGRGKVFYTALGHTNAAWQDPRLVADHVVPAVLWALGR